MIRDCTGKNNDGQISDEKCSELTKPLRIGSAKKYKSQHVNDIFRKTKNYEKKREMAEILNGLVRNTPEEMGRIELLEILYSAAIKSINGEKGYNIAILPVERELESRDSVDEEMLKSNYYRGAGGRLFSPSQCRSLMELVTVSTSGNTAIRRPKYPSEDDRINNMYWSEIKN